MILGRIYRIVQEQLTNPFVEELRNLVSWFILAVPLWLLRGFFQPLTLNFWVAATYLAISWFLVRTRSFRYAGAASLAACLALVGYCSFLSLTATYILATDQDRIRYGQVSGVSYLEIPSTFPIIDRLPPELIRPRLISVISCGGVKVAKLPLLPFTPTKADRTLPASPLQFRRLPLLSYDGLEASIETSVGKNDGQKGIGFSVSFVHIFRSINLTNLFPRSISCMDNSIPLIPIMEILPWDPDHTNQLISAVAKVYTLRDVYLHGTATPQIIRTISLHNDESSYNSLLDFTSDSLMFEMLQGNLLAESRADIRNRLCITIKRDQSAFSGPFASLSKMMKRSLAYAAARTFKSIYPACDIEDEVFSQIDSLPLNAQEFPNWVTAMSNCSRSQTASDLLSCLGNSPFYHRKDENCEAAHCGAALTGVVSSEDEVRSYEKPFDGRVVSGDGHLIEPSTLDPVECPTLRDAYEDSYLLNWRGARAWSIWDKPAQCMSPEWQSRFLQSKEDHKSELRCARQKGFGAPTDDDVDRLYDLTRAAYCSPSFDKLATSPLVASLFELFDHSAEFKAELMNYADWIDPRRIEEMVDSLTQIENVKTSLCGNGTTQQCLAFWGSDSDNRLAEMLNQLLGHIRADTDSSTKMRATFDALSRSDNFIVKIAICDLLARSDISQKIGVSREAFCRSHGLSRYMAVSEHIESNRLDRTFQAHGGHEIFGTAESRVVYPSTLIKSYGREWMRKLFPSSTGK
jgi:hypothetical protein